MSSVATTPSAAVVDVGAGASLLADSLLGSGYRDVTVLDVSEQALASARRRLGQRPGLHLVVADVLEWSPHRQYDVWHDRAVFHFLAPPVETDQYRRVAAAAVRPGGALVIGTFAEDGPSSCSGLPTSRDSPDALAKAFRPEFREERREREDHVTPSGVKQPFTWLVLRREPAPRAAATSGRL